MDPRSNTRAKQPALKRHLEGPHEQRGRLHSRQHSALKIRPVKRNPLICAINVAGDNALKYLKPTALFTSGVADTQTDGEAAARQTDVSRHLPGAVHVVWKTSWPNAGRLSALQTQPSNGGESRANCTRTAGGVAGSTLLMALLNKPLSKSLVLGNSI